MQTKANLITEPNDEAVQKFDPADRCGLISLVTALASVLYTVWRPFETLDELVSLAAVFSVISILNGRSVKPGVALAILLCQFVLVKSLPLLS